MTPMKLSKNRMYDGNLLILHSETIVLVVTKQMTFSPKVDIPWYNVIPGNKLFSCLKTIF